MQVKVITLAIPALAMFAFAQTQDPNQSRQQDTSGQQTMGTETQQGTRTETESGTTTTRPPRQARTETSKAHTYRGTLVDASCAMAKAGMPAQAPSAERSTTEESHAGTMGTTGTVPHVDTKAVLQSCPITSTTKDFALVLHDGRLVQIDQAGDAKVASELKTNDKWNKALNSNKRITASVKGTLQGDTLQVESVK